MIRFLLDTDICIYLINQRPREVPETFRLHSPAEVGISVITVFELEYGARKSHQRSQARNAITRFLSPLNIVDMDRKAALHSATIRAELEKRGTPIGPFDLLIAGLARSRSLTLVTNNTREFRRVNDLNLENWVGNGP